MGVLIDTDEHKMRFTHSGNLLSDSVRKFVFFPACVRASLDVPAC
jgi:hypothetical protein